MSAGQRGWRLWLGALAIAASVVALHAQAPPSVPVQAGPSQTQVLEQQLQEFDQVYRLRTAPGRTISEKLLLDYGVLARFGVYSIDDAFSHAHILRQTDIDMYLLAELGGAHRFFGLLRFLYNDWSNGEDFEGEGDGLENPIGDKYWYEFDLRGLITSETGARPDYNFNAKLGRQYVTWGSGLTLNNTLYAGLFDIEYAKFGFTALAGITPSTGTVDYDFTRPRFNNQAERAFFGGNLEYRGLANHVPYAFFLIQRDENDDDPTSFQTLFGEFPTLFKYDSEYFGLGSRGSIGSRIRYRVEGVYETGHGLSNSFDPFTFLPVEQTEENIDAWAGVAAATYLLGDQGDSRFDAAFLIGSGDSDRLNSSGTFGGNRRGTRDHAFNTIGYVDTGLALAPDVTNLVQLKLGGSTAPFGNSDPLLRGLRLGAYGYLFGKTISDGPISVPTVRGESFLGGEIDLYLDWRFTSDFSMSVRYGIFLPNTDAFPDDQDKPRQFFYAGVTYAF